MMMSHHIRMGCRVLLHHIARWKYPVILAALSIPAAGCGLLFLFAGDVAAQQQPNSAPQYKFIPLDEDSSDLRTLRSGSGSNAYRQITNRSLELNAPSRDRRFLAGIDVSDLERTLNIGETRSLSSFQRTFENTIEERTDYEEINGEASAFETVYPELNATLTCHWIYDANLSQRIADLEAKAEEAQLDRAHRSGTQAEENKSVTPEEDGQGDTDQPGASDDSNYDAHLGLAIVERQFKIAGRPCLLTAICERRNDVRCQSEFVDQLADNVRMIRTPEHGPD